MCVISYGCIVTVGLPTLRTLTHCISYSHTDCLSHMRVCVYVCMCGIYVQIYVYVMCPCAYGCSVV